MFNQTLFFHFEKNLFWIISLIVFPFLLQAQEKKETYTMFETVYMEVDKDKMAEFEAGMKEHNKKYHNKAPFLAEVWAVRTGARAGSLVWMKGPLTFADLDNEAGEGHGKHWREKVIANCASTGPTEYWKQKDEFVKNPTKQNPIVHVRFLEVNSENGQGFRIDGLFKQMTETVKAMPGDSFWGIYENEFRQGKQGRHFSVVTGYDKWGELDNDTFKSTFDKVHGEGSFTKWQREMRDVFVDGYDEIWTQVPNFSASNN